MYNTLEAAMDAALEDHKEHGCSVHVNVVLKVTGDYTDFSPKYKVEVDHFTLSDWYCDGATVASAKHGEVATV